MVYGHTKTPKSMKKENLVKKRKKFGGEQPVVPHSGTSIQLNDGCSYASPLLRNSPCRLVPRKIENPLFSQFLALNFFGINRASQKPRSKTVKKRTRLWRLTIRFRLERKSLTTVRRPPYAVGCGTPVAGSARSSSRFLTTIRLPHAGQLKRSKSATLPIAALHHGHCPRC
jgi:hypothetical protein